MDEAQKQEGETVDIVMPEEASQIADIPADPNATASILIPANPQLQHNDIQPQEEALSTGNPQIERDEKGQIIKGIAQDTNKNGTAGRPCTLCQNKEELLMITKEYIDSGKGDKPRMVYVNELAIKLGCYRDIIAEWRSKKLEDGSLEHPEFADYIKELESIQELRLQQRTMGRYNPTGAIFLLKTKHKYIETEKQLLGNADDKDLRITIVEEEK